MRHSVAGATGEATGPYKQPQHWKLVQMTQLRRDWCVDATATAKQRPTVRLEVLGNDCVWKIMLEQSGERGKRSASSTLLCEKSQKNSNEPWQFVALYHRYQYLCCRAYQPPYALLWMLLLLSRLRKTDDASLLTPTLCNTPVLGWTPSCCTCTPHDEKVENLAMHIRSTAAE